MKVRWAVQKIVLFLAVMIAMPMLAADAQVTGSSAVPVAAPAAEPIQIAPQALPDAVAGTPYAQPLSAVTPASGPFYWTVNGNLPGGLSLSTVAAGVEIAGTPSTAGASTFSISVTNRDIAATQTYFFTVDAGDGASATPPAMPPTQTPSSAAESSLSGTLDAQLNAIAAALQLLQNGIAGAGTRGGQGQILGASTGSIAQAPAFYRNLTVGDTGTDVLALQQFLNDAGYPVAVSGPGAPGNETPFFGPATQAALAKWQAATGITPASGYFGPITRAQINLLTSSTDSAALPLQTQIESTEL